MNCRGRAGSRAFAIVLAALLGVGALATPAGAAVPGTSPQPTISAGNGQITVTFAAPPSNGGKSITAYTASCTPSDPNNGIFAQVSNTGAVAPIVVPGLTNGAAYTCSVHATNADGTGNESPDSLPAVVGAPATPAQPVATPGHAADHRRVQPSRQQRQRDHELHGALHFPAPVCRAATRARCRRS